MTVVIVVVAVLVVVALSVWAARHVRHPEQTASHADVGGRTDSDRFYTDTDRPAGPDAEEPVGGLHRRDDDMP